MTRQTYSLDDIKQLLLAQRHNVARHYAPPAPGSYHDKGGYWTLNPGRADKSVGSFVVWLEGARAGRWNDYAMSGREAGGDLIDLIQLYLGSNAGDAIKEARSFLGLSADSPEDAARRKAAIERSKQLQAEARRQDAEAKALKSKRAHALWLSGQEAIKGTPVEYYLRDQRGIDLAHLGRQPRALRYHPDVPHRSMDPETGEIIEGRFPAMLALACDAGGNAVACHRTWLAIDRHGRWNKAPVPKPKMVLGDYARASIHLWSGYGPRGGKGKRLAEADTGSRVYVAEGIEDALSCVLLLPAARVLCAISVSNFAGLQLPEAITEITFVADEDGPEAAATKALQAAVQAHAAAGRTVRLWLNRRGGKDLNDALRQAIAAETMEGAEDAEAQEHGKA